MAQNECVRLVLGAIKTSPVRKMHHLAAIPPVEFSMRKLRVSAAIRLKTLPHRGEIASQLRQADDEERVTTTLTLLPLPNSQLDETTTPFVAQPKPDRLTIKLPEPNLDAKQRKAYEQGLLAEVKKAANNEDSLALFTDGSRKMVRHTKRTGCGSVLIHRNQNIDAKFRHLGRKHTIYDGEMMGLAIGMVTAAHHVRQHPSRYKRLVLTADNQAAVGTIADISASCRHMRAGKHSSHSWPNPAPSPSGPRTLTGPSPPRPC